MCNASTHCSILVSMSNHLILARLRPRALRPDEGESRGLRAS